jgi:LCP family protein required for cell wall assembly
MTDVVRTRSPWHRGFVFRLGVAFVISTGLMTVGLVSVEHAVEAKIARTHTAPVRTVPVAPSAPQNFLIIGSDSRQWISAGDQKAADEFKGSGDAGQRSDTMMVARVDPQTKTVFLMSLPRDLLVTNSTGHTVQINSFFNNGDAGAQDLINVLKAAPFNIPINHYLEVNFEGFKGIVDAIGGIRVWFDQPAVDGGFVSGTWTRYTSFVAPSRGCWDLNGEQARAYVRSRDYNVFLPNGKRFATGTDTDRITRQQAFLRLLAAKILKKTGSDYFSALDLSDQLIKYITIDPQLKKDLRGEIALIDTYAEVNPNDPNAFQTSTFPWKADPQQSGRLLPDWTAAAPYLARFQTSAPTTATTAPGGTTVPGATTTGVTATTLAPIPTTTTTQPLVTDNQVVPAKYMPSPAFIPTMVNGVITAAACK